MIVQALHKFHKRIVAEQPEGFQALGEREEIFLSDTAQFLTLQGHPEMTASIAHQLVNKSDGSYLSGSAPEIVSETLKRLDICHDGEIVFARAMNWAFGSVPK